ncbi:MAG TPA: aminotransferase class III-fold pyridoxal phosphate-dependent enzyme, partial [Usitatibacteraceae bacterium]|nr:aminotransferase class III-fold pyridoxal phosphate-dependent enzyme [Usitatibacteraceae bacterium]
RSRRRSRRRTALSRRQTCDALREALAGVAGVREIRGRGLMIGVELDRPCGEIVGLALAAGLVANVTAERVIRLLPPLVIREEETREIVARLVPVVKAFLASGAAAGSNP